MDRLPGDSEPRLGAFVPLAAVTKTGDVSAGRGLAPHTSAFLQPQQRSDSWITSMLNMAHQRFARASLQIPDEAGTFPDSAPGVVPLVLDANVLRDDVLYATRNRARTTLIALANSGPLRLYAAPHVRDEVTEHLSRWAQRRDLSEADTRLTWEEQYQPLIRWVEPPLSLLSVREQARIGELSDVDPDDVPSAALAVVLGAFFASRDHRAVKAVYGPDHDVRRNSRWLDIVQAHGDAHELDEFVRTMGGLGSGVVAGLADLAKWLYARVPWSLPALSVGAIFGFNALSLQRRQQLKEAGLGLLGAMSELVERQGEALRLAREASLDTPDWRALGYELDDASLLARACVFTMARLPTSHRSAADLAGMLPPLTVAQSEPKVRTVLRETPGCFAATSYRGQWQLGHSSRR